SEFAVGTGSGVAVTTTTTTTTTTLIQGPDDRPVAGTKLVLRTPAHPTAQKIVLSGKDIDISMANEDLSSADPVRQGGSLRIIPANAPEQTYPLPTANAAWKYAGQPTENRGYLYKDPKAAAGPVVQVVVKSGKVKVVGKGAGLQLSLG